MSSPRPSPVAPPANAPDPRTRRSRWRAGLGAAVIGLALLTSGCPPPNVRPPVMKDGKECGVTSGWIWRSTWWNFYERGQSWAECDLLDYATQDFQMAIERREADQRHARTYGMHFLDDYFPHRELGIALLRQGKLEQADKELQQSLGAEPSARAKFYLNEVRRQSLRRRGLGPLPGPVLQLDVAPSFATREPSVWISGRAHSEQYVGAIQINGVAQLIELGDTEVPFRTEVPVGLGENSVPIIATDLLGNRSETVIRITGDREGPVVAIQDIQLERGGELTLIGTVQDTAGLAAVEIAGVELARDRSPVLQLQQKLTRPADDRITFRAQDLLGNETVGTIILEGAGSAAADAAVARRIVPRPVLVAALDSDQTPPGQVFRGTLPDLAADPTLLAASTLNEIRWKLGEKLDAALDRAPPLIRIDGLAETQTVYLDRILVTGNASDDSRVVSIELDHRVAEVRNTAQGPVPAEQATIPAEHKVLQFTPGREVFFSAVMPLGEGPNEIHVVSTDLSGKRAERVLQITRRPTAIHDPSIRLVLAPMPFREGETLSDVSDTLENFLIDGLVDQHRYRIVDREILAKVIAEQSLALSKLIDPDAAVRLGRLVASDAILSGRAYRRGASLEAWVKIIDNETGEDLVIEDTYGETIGTADIRPLMATLAQKLALAIPALEAPITNVDGDRVTIGKGTADRLKPNLRVALFHRVPAADSPTGALALSPTYDPLGRGRLVNVEAAQTEAELDKPKPANPVRTGDLMVIR